MAKVIDLKIRRLPTRHLKTLRSAALKNGIPDTHTAIIRWATSQYAILLLEREAAQPKKGVKKP